MVNQIEKLADAIINDIYGSLKGYHTNLSISKDQLMLEIIDERLLIIREFTLKGNLPATELMLSINCIPVDCKNLSKCCNSYSNCDEPTAHFEIPQLVLDYGLDNSILYIGSVDKKHPFLVYTQALDKVNSLLKYRKRGKNKPYVYIDVTPNENGMFDCFVFGAPLLKQVSVTAIFKDVRQLQQYSCCNNINTDDYSFLNSLIRERLTKKKILYYRSFAPLNKPNDLLYE